MKKPKPIIIVALAALLVAGGGFLLADHWAEKQAARNAIAVDSSSNPIQQVSLSGDKATPDTVTILAGRSVQFNSADGKTHELAQGEGTANGHTHDHEGEFSSGEFKAGEAWRVQFKKPGTYFFHDHDNPNINILVIVYEHKTK